MRFFRALLVLEILQRLFASSPEKRLPRLYDQLQIKEEELEDLRREIAALEAVKELNEQNKQRETRDEAERKESQREDLIAATKEANQSSEG